MTKGTEAVQPREKKENRKLQGDLTVAFQYF